MTATLIGASIALAVTGLPGGFAGVFAGFEPVGIPIPLVVTGVSLIVLGVAVRVPQRFLLWCTARAWQFLRNTPPTDGPAIELLNVTGDDRALYWTVQSVLALIAGVMTALLPALLRTARAVAETAHEHFVWSIPPLGLFQSCLIGITILPPFAILGLCASACHHLRPAGGVWDSRATAWLLGGAAMGVGVGEGVAGFGKPGLTLLGAGLPALVVALLATAMCAQSARGREHIPIGGPAGLPLYRDRWPRLLRWGIACVGASVAGTATAWLGIPVIGGDRPQVALAIMLATAAAGFIVGCRGAVRNERALGGLGTACALAGGVLSAGAAAVTGRFAVSAGTCLVIASLGLGTIGFATAYGREALFARVAGRSFAGAGTLARMLIAAGVTTWIGVPLAQHVFGRTAALVMLSLSLLALGGSLVIFEPGYSPTGRRARLGAVFGVVGMLLLVFRSLGTTSGAEVGRTLPARTANFP